MYLWNNKPVRLFLTVLHGFSHTEAPQKYEDHKNCKCSKLDHITEINVLPLLGGVSVWPPGGARDIALHYIS